MGLTGLQIKKPLVLDPFCGRGGLLVSPETLALRWRFDTCAIDSLTLLCFHVPVNEREYKRLKDQIDTNYRSQIERLEAERTKKLEALEIVWQTVQEAAATSNSATLIEAIRGVVSELQDTFNINDVIALIESRYPQIPTPINPTSVSGTLAKLARIRELELVEAGKGKRPSQYRIVRNREQEVSAN